MPIQPDKETLEKLKTADLKAFEAVFSFYEKAIYGYIFGLVGQKEAAEDITQETFVKVWKSAGKINPEQNFKNWLYKIAGNTARDWLRAKGRRPELFIIDDEESNFETIDEDAAYLTIGDASDIKAAMEKIKPVHRACLLLFYYEGLGYEEIADILSLPLNTVKTHIRRAKNELKEKL